MYKVISFGHRCSSASFIKRLNLKTESYPFDWLISKLDVIQNCIETRFVHFLHSQNYVTTDMETFNLIDNVKHHICYETIQVNTYYESDSTNNQTYQCKLAMNHRNILNDYEYYKRCINRLYELLDSDIQKYYVYIHPIIGINDLLQNQENIVTEFDTFSVFISNYTKNIFGVYFILVKYTDIENRKSVKIRDTPTYTVFIIYCSDEVIDGGKPFMGNPYREMVEILTILQNIFV